MSAAGWGVLWALVFLAHATCYLYFFVDDEGITAVFAKNLLAGHGLSYSAAEGPAEGYSNFLQVWVVAALLWVTRTVGLDRLWVLGAGSAVSLACGTALVALVWRVAGRLGLPTGPRVAATGMLALAGPLAVWSNSSLETVPFALAFLIYVTSTLPAIRRPGLAALAGLLVLLLRIDGALYVGAWTAARLVTADAADRRTLWRKVVPALLVSAVAYVAWRRAYVGAWLPPPLESKVAHKLLTGAGSVIWRPETGYLERFVRHSGLPVPLALIAAACALAARDAGRRVVWALAGLLAVLLAYAAVVNDWMFGSRFTVALLAPLALLVGLGLAAIGRTRPRLAQAVACLLIVWSIAGAWRFSVDYRTSEDKPFFWSSPSLDPARRFGGYWDIYATLRPLVSPGMVVAFHEAGFVPFMLDLENIDMLGLGTRFFAALPTRDAVFTDLGRYYPLTPEPAFSAAHAYLVNREPAFVVVRKRWLRESNHGRVPSLVLDGQYEAVADTDAYVVYGRTARPRDPLRAAPEGFLENLAHPAYADRIAVNGTRLDQDGAVVALPSLWQGRGHPIEINPQWSLHVRLRRAEEVREVYVEGSAPAGPLRVEIALDEARGGHHVTVDRQLPAGQPIRLWERFPAWLPVDSETVRFTPATGTPVRIHLGAIRVMGQTRALREHLAREGIETKGHG